MNLRESFGLILTIGGVILFPLGWIISTKILAGSFFLLIIGVWLFHTNRILKKNNDLPLENDQSSREIRGSSGDIHNYRGTHTGGRREDPETFFDGDDVD